MESFIIMGILAGMGVLALIAFICSGFKVEEGHYGVLTAFGAVVKEPSGKPRLYSSGFHVKKPWQKAHIFSWMEKVQPLSEADRDFQVIVQDGSVLKIDSQLRFQFDPKHAEAFLFRLRDPIGHLRELFRTWVAHEMGRFGSAESPDGSYAEIRRKRVDLSRALQERCPDAVTTTYGMKFRSIDIGEILPPADLASALNAVQKTEAENETLLSKVQAECEQQVTAAKHAVEIARMQAKAVEDEILVLGDALESMHKDGVLDDYVARRKGEVSAMSRTVYMKN